MLYSASLATPWRTKARNGNTSSRLVVPHRLIHDQNRHPPYTHHHRRSTPQSQDPLFIILLHSPLTLCRLFQPSTTLRPPKTQPLQAQADRIHSCQYRKGSAQPSRSDRASSAAAIPVHLLIVLLLPVSACTHVDRHIVGMALADGSTEWQGDYFRLLTRTSMPFW